LERIRAKVKGLVQSITANFMITLDHLAEMNSKSSERFRSKFKDEVVLLTENLDSLFFDQIDRHGSVTSANLTPFMSALGVIRTFATSMRS